MTSKELEALKEFRNSQYQGVNVYADELLDIIETGLKKLETLEEENKSLRKNNENLDETYFDTWSACERLKENSNYALMFVDGVYCLVDTKDNKFEVIDNYKINSKGIIDNGTKKAFEIIKNKRVDVGLLIRCLNAYCIDSALQEYNQWTQEAHLTQEECNLLKKELKNEISIIK